MDNVLSILEEILEQRKSASAENSYVASLYNKGTDQILEKIREESAEVIMAAKGDGNDKIIHEVADLWFHVLVLLRYKNISVSDIETELARRFGISGLEEKRNRSKKT
ncbi:MAG: phosphoribosyl-ATP diphosphatase [Candidatus Thioglobus sp.]|jgi:phosphoribosyl-ATP pyrophosphohydrolase|nr:phosphoribosyl-ATP diphosphatase [Candidatus Neomarinimicrobiota bacterium]MDP7553501.1 phosphoribosyl-ATP diphosphatase [Candidatus Thioglobus sp.]|tara:strand:- start:235 stop:558 length:324 start_codon:yes stop_codon:yes gene_type:complete